MEFTLREIEGRVYALLNQNKEIVDERVEFGDPCMSVTSLIGMFTEDAARLVLSTAPASRVDECSHYPALNGMHRVPAAGGGISQIMCELTRNPLTGKTRIQLPDNFLRLIFFRMSDWEDGVQTPMAYGGDECRLRMGARIGYRSHRHRPAVAIDQRGATKFLEIFGSGEGATVAEFDYLTVPRLVAGKIDLPPALFGDVCEKIAEMIELVLDKPTL